MVWGCVEGLSTLLTLPLILLIDFYSPTDGAAYLLQLRHCYLSFLPMLPEILLRELLQSCQRSSLKFRRFSSKFSLMAIPLFAMQCKRPMIMCLYFAQYIRHFYYTFVLTPSNAASIMQSIMPSKRPPLAYLHNFYNFSVFD